jgi:hypothetical protein
MIGRYCGFRFETSSSALWLLSLAKCTRGGHSAIERPHEEDGTSGPVARRGAASRRPSGNWATTVHSEGTALSAAIGERQYLPPDLVYRARLAGSVRHGRVSDVVLVVTVLCISGDPAALWPAGKETTYAVAASLLACALQNPEPTFPGVLFPAVESSQVSRREGWKVRMRISPAAQVLNRRHATFNSEG